MYTRASNGTRNRSGRTGDPDAGFSIIEIMVASAIASIIMLMVYSSYKSILTSIKRSIGTAEFYEDVNLAFLKIDQDLSNAYFTQNNKKISFAGTVEGESSRIIFVTVNHNEYMIHGNIRKPNPVSDVKEVSYYLKKDPEIRGLHYLMKHERLQYYDDRTESPGMESILLPNVVGVRFDFRSGNDWTQQWDSRQNNKFPTAVRTTITVKNYQKKEEKFEFISIINLKKT